MLGKAGFAPGLFVCLLTRLSARSREAYALGADESFSKPLAVFTAMEHPMKARVKEMAAEAVKQTGEDSGAQVIVKIGPGGKEKGIGPSGMFYAQSRVFADFLIETSGDPAIFASIADRDAKGTPLPEWLAQERAARKLPGSIEALQAAFDSWLAKTYATP